MKSGEQINQRMIFFFSSSPELNSCTCLRRESENPIETTLNLGQILPVEVFQLKATVPRTIVSRSLCNMEKRKGGLNGS